MRSGRLRWTAGLAALAVAGGVGLAGCGAATEPMGDVIARSVPSLSETPAEDDGVIVFPADQSPVLGFSESEREEFFLGTVHDEFPSSVLMEDDELIGVGRTAADAYRSGLRLDAIHQVAADAAAGNLPDGMAEYLVTAGIAAFAPEMQAQLEADAPARN